MCKRCRVDVTVWSELSACGFIAIKDKEEYFKDGHIVGRSLFFPQ